MNLAALRSPDFRWYYAGAVSAVNGMWIMRIVLGWLSWQISGSAIYVGVIAAVSLLPTVVCGPFFGVLVDRANIKKAAYTTNLSMVACTILLTFLYVNDAITQISLAIVALLIGIVTSAHHPVRLSLGPRLVKAQFVGSVVALAALNFNLARLLSPALGGLLIDGLGITQALIVILLLFIPNLAVLYRLHPRTMRSGKDTEGFTSAFMSGLSYIWASPFIRGVLLATAVFSVSIRGILELLPIVADGSFGRGAVGLGQLGSAVGAGALCAAILKILGRSDMRTDQGILSPGNLLIAILGILALPVLGSATSWLVVLTAAAVLGFSGTHLGVGMQSIIQADLPDDMRGRVMSIWVVIGLGGTALGAFVIGALSDRTGISTATLVIGALSLGATATVYLSSKSAKKEGGR